MLVVPRPTGAVPTLAVRALPGRRIVLGAAARNDAEVGAAVAVPVAAGAWIDIT
jgi:hypothetical protein